MLTGVTIKRFKAIEDLALPLDRLNLLIGGNNSGKTSILQGIQFAVAVVQTLRSLGAPWQRNKVSYSFASSQLVYLPLRDVAPLRWRRRGRRRLIDVAKCSGRKECREKKSRRYRALAKRERKSGQQNARRRKI